MLCTKTLIISLFVLLSVVANAQNQSVVLDVPYIHQYLDMNQNQFKGDNACGSTSCVMKLTNYGLLPLNPSTYLGYFVYNSYGEFADLNGNRSVQFLEKKFKI